MNPRSKLTFPMGLRVQLLALVVFLFVVPWLGYRYIETFEEHLYLGQAEALSRIAMTTATALREQPGAFNRTAMTAGIDRSRDLYAYELRTPPRLDGRANDWHEHLQHAITYGRDNIIEQQGPVDSLSFDHIAGIHGDSLYAFFRVTDDRIVYREINSISVHRNDNVQIALDRGGDLRRYTIATVQPGEVTAFAVTPRDRGGRALSLEPRIHGYWRATEYGYNLEIEIPLNMVGENLGFAIADVDDEDTRAVSVIIGTSNIYDVTAIGTITIPSGELEQRLADLGHGSSSILVLDRHRRVIAKAGDITMADGIWSAAPGGQTSPIANGLLDQVFGKLLPQPPGHFVDTLTNAANVPGEHIGLALKGTPVMRTRLSSDRAATILSAAHPVLIDNEVVGAIVAEQTTNGIIASRNHVTQRLLTASVLVLVTGGLVLFLAGSVLAFRIKRLRRQVENSVDTQGRVRQLLPGSMANDEIGDLSRSFTDIIGRLRQYNTYLEDMSHRLAHELRTPVTVVRSSLDNLAMQALGDDEKVYVERANEGVHRLSSILTSMSEATRLEQSLDAADQELFDLTEVVRGSVQGYEYAWPDKAFVLSIETGPLKIEGIPDLVAQMLDKLVSNAVDFASGQTPIKVRLTLESDHAVIRVINDGPRLPEAMQDRLFDSMVSVRGSDAGRTGHLGLGLYIARIITEFHGGTITAGNREDASGVIVTVRLPIMRLTGQRL